MNLIVSSYKDTNRLFNTTGDYNIMYGLESLTHTNPNYKIISYKAFVDKISLSFDELENFIGDKLNCIIAIQVYIFHSNLPKDINIYYYVIDIHGHCDDINKVTEYTNLHLILPYAYCYNIYNYKPNLKLFFLPHSIAHSISFNNNPKHKICISGRGVKNASRYPMRVIMYKLSLQNNNLEYFKPDHNYRIEYNNVNNITCGRHFIQLLNSYLVCFCDDSIYYSPYIVCKFFEILSSGALLLTSLTNTKRYFDKLGFIENEDYINIDTNNLLETINYVMDINNIDEINRIRYNGYMKATKFHTSEYRAKQLNEIILNSNNVVKYNDGINGTEYYLVNNI